MDIVEIINAFKNGNVTMIGENKIKIGNEEMEFVILDDERVKINRHIIHDEEIIEQIEGLDHEYAKKRDKVIAEFEKIVKNVKAVSMVASDKLEFITPETRAIVTFNILHTCPFAARGECQYCEEDGYECQDKLYLTRNDNSICYKGIWFCLNELDIPVRCKLEKDLKELLVDFIID